MKKIAFATMKGGVGKTSLSVNIAAILAKRGKKVLFIDTDPQCNATEALNLDMKTIDAEFSAMGLFTGERVNMEDLVYMGMFEQCPDLPLHVIPSHMKLIYTERQLQDGIHNNNPNLKEAQVLGKVFEDNKALLDSYDYVIFDTNTYLSQINENVFTIIDTLLAITDPSYGGLMGVLTYVGLWDRICDELGLEPEYTEAILFNKYESNNNMNKKIYSLLQGSYANETEEALFGAYKDAFVDYPIPKTIKFEESSFTHTPLAVSNRSDQKIILKKLEELIDKMIEGGLL